ncbi:MAG: DUF1622 domain-containing protein [Opitutales bacterium]
MNEWIKPVAESCAAFTELLGLGIIVGFACYALILGTLRLLARSSGEAVFREVRQTLGRGILLGLEFLVAADIIHTVAVDLTFPSVGTLALVVAIRTFLSFTLEVELTGRWPWQEGK